MDKAIQYTLRIKRIHCYLSQEAEADEIFIKYQGKKIWPEKKYMAMKEGAFEVGFETRVSKGSTTIIEVWEYDFWTPNDLLGTVNIVADNMGGPYTTDLSRKDEGNARYAIEWELG